MPSTRMGNPDRTAIGRLIIQYRMERVVRWVGWGAAGLGIVILALLFFNFSGSIPERTVGPLALALRLPEHLQTVEFGLKAAGK